MDDDKKDDSNVDRNTKKGKTLRNIVSFDAKNRIRKFVVNISNRSSLKLLIILYKN